MSGRSVLVMNGATYYLCSDGERARPLAQNGLAGFSRA
jgi:hypothetical protein